MPRPDDAQLKGKLVPPAAPAASPAPQDVSECTCLEFRRNQVCDHVLMAAAVRMVRRMIDAHAQAEKPH
jgi:hypothetical protein